MFESMRSLQISRIFFIERRRTLLIGIASIVLFWASSASADETTPSAPIVVTFSYEAPPECPKEARAFSLVHERS